MHISVDINQLEAHLVVLETEARETKILDSLLRNWMQNLQIDSCVNMELLQQQQQIIRKQSRYIENRLTLLKSTIERFSLEKRKTENLLQDAMSTLKSQGSLL